jgi:hypothetical protein
MTFYGQEVTGKDLLKLLGASLAAVAYVWMWCWIRAF